MIVLLAGLAVLWFLLSRPKLRRSLDARTLSRLIKSAAAGFIVLAAAVVFLRGHVEVALLLLGGGLYLFNLAGRATVPPVRGASRSTVSRVRSATIEMELDLGTGAMQGTVLAGPQQGRRLDAMSPAECEALYQACRASDPEGAQLLEAYLDRRFPGWREAGEGDADARRRRARHANGMSEEEAYQVLGLARGAARDEVVRAHRALMKRFHPDQGGSTDLAARVNEAKEVLTRRHT